MTTSNEQLRVLAEKLVVRRKDRYINPKYGEKRLLIRLPPLKTPWRCDITRQNPFNNKMEGQLALQVMPDDTAAKDQLLNLHHYVVEALVAKKAVLGLTGLTDKAIEERLQPLLQPSKDYPPLVRTKIRAGWDARAYTKGARVIATIELKGLFIAPNDERITFMAELANAKVLE